MLLALLAAGLMNRLAQAGHALALAWLAIVVVDPFAVMAPGLWLSFGAVLAISYLASSRYRAEAAWRAAIRELGRASRREGVWRDVLLTVAAASLQKKKKEAMST